jgi:hypothetical protein
MKRMGADRGDSSMNGNVKSKTPEAKNHLRRKYLSVAIREYEYSFAPEYQRRHMTRRAAEEGTVDFESYNALSDVGVTLDGAWVNARVWVPQKWLEPK